MLLHLVWVNPFGVAFALMKASDLILVNHDGTHHSAPRYSKH
jgi:ribulose-5-phosphate 4-epimerase/fuculose-1-phosphate aldolase